MIADRNKTALTHKITDAAYRWLDNHGFKPVETEVWMPGSTNGDNQKGWVADLASVIYPTQTELINLRFIKRPPPWRYRSGNEGYEEKRAAWDSEFKKIFRRMTALIEVKSSRSDFLGDRKWKMIAPTDLAWVAMQTGVASISEVPEAWGVLILRGDEVHQLRIPTPRVATVEEHLHVIYQIAIRRDHRTRYAQEREWQKEYRIRDAEEREERKIDKVISAVRDIARGHHGSPNRPILSVKEALEYYGIKKVSWYQIEMLEKLLPSPVQSSPENQPSSSDGSAVPASTQASS